MAKFTVKEGDRGEPCFIVDEDTNFIVRLKPPANMAHAEKVRKFLTENIRNIDVDPDEAPLGPMLG